MLVVGSTAMRIDSPEELDAILHEDQFIPIPLAVAAFLLVLGLFRRTRLVTRSIGAIVVGVALWFFTWQLLHQGHLDHVRARGGDPESMLKNKKVD